MQRGSGLNIDCIGGFYDEQINVISNTLTVFSIEKYY